MYIKQQKYSICSLLMKILELVSRKGERWDEERNIGSPCAQNKTAASALSGCFIKGKEDSGDYGAGDNRDGGFKPRNLLSSL